MTDAQLSDAEAEVELKGKGFDEVCELIKNDDQLTGAVHKRPDGAGRWSYCFGFRADEYSEADLLDLIVAEYGPGTYPVQFKGKQKNGRPRLAWQKHMHVQARRRVTQNLEVTTSGQAPAPAPANDALAAAMERQAVALEALAASIAKPPAEQKTTIDFVQDLAAIKDLFSDNQRSALEQFKDAMELRKLIKDDDGDGASDPFSTAVKLLTPAIEKGVEALQEREAAQFSRPGAPAPAPAAAPNVAPFDPGADHSTDEIPTDEQINEAAIVYAFQFISEKYLPAIMQLAETGQDPASVAEYFVRLIGSDEKTIHMLGVVLSQDDMVVRFAKFNARVLQFTAWLDCVGDNLAHALWPATNPPAEAFNATIDATIDKTDDDGGINDAESTGLVEPADLTASGEPTPDAEPSPDSQGKGHDNDA